MRKWILFASILIGCHTAGAQNKALVNTERSIHAALQPVNMQDVQFTTGFLAERFNVCREVMIPELYKTYTSPEISHAFKNFQIAAALDTGSHSGPPFHDGDFYKLLEGIAAMYAVTRNEELNTLMDSAIMVIARAQRADGYIHTPVIIEEKKNGRSKAFNDRLNFETYNLGHLMTAACIHYRATGKKNFLKLAEKAVNYLVRFYNEASPELARNAICPSHYMGVVEMYRTTGHSAYLDLAKNLIDIRGMVENGTDDNQDRIPFREQHEAMGHAVRANYLYAGVTDVFMETGDSSLYNNLLEIWKDVVNRKMYVTGACGALYDGVSPYGISYEPPHIQKTHQSYGRAYQLPNATAHNETCANIGNLLWNWRMLQLSGDARYADIVELVLYNSVLPGISLDGKDFFYTNPLSARRDFPYKLRWSGERVPYIALSNCCPPNTVRTIAEMSNYFYGKNEKGIYVHLYGGTNLKTNFNHRPLEISQSTEYPWDGNVNIEMEQVGNDSLSIFLRIPGWCRRASVKLNGKEMPVNAEPGTYVEIRRVWKKNDRISLEMPMPVELIQSNPMVEETRNQAAVKRGPIVYCLESVDLPEGTSVPEIELLANEEWETRKMEIGGSGLLVLKSLAVKDPRDWRNTLYAPVKKAPKPTVSIRMIPYFAWANRGMGDMSVWLPLK